MREVDITVPLSVPAAKVWAVLADFAGFLNWAGGGSGEIEIEGEGIGMIRHLRMAVGEIGEKLIVLDEDRKQLGYELVYGEPIGMKVYRALVTIESTSPSTCDVCWLGRFEPVDAGAEDEVAETLTATFHGMSQALEGYAASH